MFCDNNSSADTLYTFENVLNSGTVKTVKIN